MEKMVYPTNNNKPTISLNVVFLAGEAKTNWEIQRTNYGIANHEKSGKVIPVQV
jgi:hypothetical protein